MNESEFLKLIEADPVKPVPRLVYTDWLDDQGDPHGELLRIQEELRRIDVSHRAGKEARMHELLRDGVQSLTITHTTSIGMKLILIFPGDYFMGSPEDEEGRDNDENQVDGGCYFTCIRGRNEACDKLVTIGSASLSYPVSWQEVAY